MKKFSKTLFILTIIMALNINTSEVHALSYSNTNAINQTIGKNHGETHWKLCLDELVKSGTINEKQKDAVLNLINSDNFHKVMKKNHRCHKNKLDTLVQNKTITNEQKSAIEQLILSSKNQGKNFKDSFNKGLDELVSKKIITESQKSAIKNLFTSCRKERKKQFATSLDNELDALVKNKTITQKQKESIVKSLTDFKH